MEQTITTSWSRDRGFLFISYHNTIRDLSAYRDNAGNPLPSAAQVKDSIIQEVAADGTELFRWNSWDHLDVETDCRLVEKYLNGKSEYAHLNSGQHHATLTATETVVLFDNGVQCLGPRKELDRFSRVVEYDISSGTQATFLREYRRPDEQGYTVTGGGATVLNADDTDRNNDRWLIAWGGVLGAIVGAGKRIAFSEVDPVTGASLFELSMSAATMYRVYHQPDTGTIPLNLP